MLLTIVASDFESLSLNNVPLDPTVLYETHWQLATSSTFAPLVLIEDTWFIADDFITRDFAEAGFYVRMRVRDNLGQISDWSAPLLVSTLLPRRTLERAWAFTFDGHIFYVLNFVGEKALIYDITTKQWHRWSGQVALAEGGEPFWNMFRGIVWKGRVIAAGMEDNAVWELDPHSMLDEELTPIARKVTGFQSIRGSASQRQGSLRITARKEDAADPATITMRFSDDRGKTWSNPKTVVLASNSYSQRIEFRSLGRMRAPGRVWEISDTGGFVRIDGADADLEGEE